MPSETLQRGDLLPLFEATTTDGQPFRYADLWQRRNLVLFVVPMAAGRPGRDAMAYLDELRTRVARLQPDDTTVAAVVGPIATLPASAAVVSDRWGEITYVQELAGAPDTWPAIDEVLEWVGLIRARC
jgi:hypothetical protein